MSVVCFDPESLFPSHVTIYLLAHSSLKETALLRHLDLVFFSIVWRADFHRRTNSYDAICKHLRPHPATWIDRIEDVGSWGRWHRLEKVKGQLCCNKYRTRDIDASELR